jgi:beta-carotene ketolase (CrtO type)
VKEDHYDVVIVGGGHNGTTIGAYLAKSGLSTVILEARPECGGGQENTEVRPGFRIDPHATYLYGGAAPGFEQLELHKYGMRMCYYPSIAGVATLDGQAVNLGSKWRQDIGLENIKKYAPSDNTATNFFETMNHEQMKELLRALFWTPPFPSHINADPKDMPWWQVFRKYFPNLWFDDLTEVSLIEFMDRVITFEPLKVVNAFGAWYCGAHPAWDGMMLQALGGMLLLSYSSGSPRGGMHTYAHAIIRCAIANGARVITNAPVGEIIVKNGRAAGVKLDETACLPEKTIWADKAVISAVDVKHTFLNMVSPSHLDRAFIQDVKDISLKGGSLFVMSVICRQLPKYHGKDEFFPPDVYPSCVIAPGDSLEFFRIQTRDAYSFKKHPELTPEHLTMMICTHDVYDSTRCREGYHILSPIYLEVPPPEYDVTGVDAINRHKDEIIKAALNLLGELAPNMRGENIVDVFLNTPYDSEFRNAGMVGGNWYGIRQDCDQWFSTRPLPELSRYRTPIENLYLCNQTSHPGGLCLMAVPYNLMHILIEDQIVEPKSWWYPSPYYVRDGGSLEVNF